MLRSRIPFRLAVGLTLAVVLDTVTQLCWKAAAVEIPAAASPWITVVAALNEPLFLVLIALLLCQLVNWLQVLGDADLSFAQPITSLSRITVCLASVLLLGERVDRLQIAGILIVCVGVWFVTRTVRETRARDRNEWTPVAALADRALTHEAVPR